jgi:hypothetical protein
MSWKDAGRTVSRLTAWRNMEEGRGVQAVQALNAIYDPTPGEIAVGAMANWLADPARPGPEVPAWSHTEGLPRQALALAEARRALVSGDEERARLAFQNVQGDLLPEEWVPTFRRIQELTDAGPGPAGEGPDFRDYRDAASEFTGGRDSDAEAKLTAWLSRWPDSPLRPHAYLLRGHLAAGTGRIEEADSDLRAAERQAAEGQVRERVRVVQAFVLAQAGRDAEARTFMNQALDGPLGEMAEGELRFDQSRLARLLGNEEMSQALVLQLEEAFPGEPWAGRAREDTVAAGWKEPWRSLPPVPRFTARVEAPREGPWGLLLWGENVLVREAEDLDAETLPPGIELQPEPEELVVESVPQPDPETAIHPSTPVAFVDLGLGVPAALILGGGVAGLSDGVHYRLDAAKTLSEGRNELPDYRRTDWEAGLGGSPGLWRLGLVAEGTARTDDEASKIGLNPESMEGSWWGVRGDVSYKEPEEEGAALSVAVVDGKVDAGTAGRWDSDQQWYALTGSMRPGGVKWEGELVLAHLDNTQTEPELTDFRRWYHSLRLARSLSGGWYAGVIGALYLDRALLMPVAGIERGFDSGWTLWAATEPSLRLPSFRETFVTNGDWNVPDLTLPAERRYLDLRGGIRWTGEDRSSVAFGVVVWKTGEYRTWRPDTTLWIEDRADDATGFRAILSGGAGASGFRVSGKLAAQSIRDDARQIAYVPRYEGWLDLSYAHRGWRLGTTLRGVAGREDDESRKYGDYFRVDLEVAYRFRTHSLPLGFRNMEFAVEIENLTDVEDRRWPDVPAYGFGIVAGVRALYGN